MDNIFTHFYDLITEAYIQRLVFAITARPKFKGKITEMPGGKEASKDSDPFFFYLIGSTYKNHLNKNKKERRELTHIKIEKDDKLQELIEIITHDLKLFNDFRYKN